MALPYDFSMKSLSMKSKAIIFASIVLLWAFMRFYFMMKLRQFSFHYFSIEDNSTKTLFNHFLIVLEALILFVVYIIYRHQGWIERIVIRGKKFIFLGVIIGVGIFISTFPIAFHFGMKVQPHLSLMNLIGNFFSNAAEEFIYRGLIYIAALSLFRSSLFAIFISSIAFGLGHWDTPYLFQSYVVLIGIALGMTYRKTDNLAAPYLAHMIADALADSFFL